MAMFAPNQVAVHLPKVISSIRAILLDTHPKVQEAGQDALNKITSAMRNQGRLNALAILEVHSEQLAKSSATENLTKALDHLLETTFVHSLDEPSLALLMPLIKDGLEAVNRKVQIKALRIIGHICSITNEPSIIAPYLNEIAPIMVNLLLTVHPKLRSASCKALAGVVKGIGLKECIGTLKWICKMLREASVAESKNITEAYEEIMPTSMDPEDIWKEELSDIESLCISDDSSNRVAGITLLVDYHRFMSCFKNHAGCQINFTEYVNKVLPMFQNALLDTNEDVRSAAVKGMKLGIETFGEDYPDLLFKQLLRGYNHGNYWIRYHTIVLLSTLLHVLGGDIHKIKPDEEKKQEGVITCYEDVISAIYILSFDSVERVSFTASSAWQLFVEKRQGRNLVAPFNDSKDALRNLIFNMIKVISCEYQEVAHSGKRALNSLMGKIFVKLLDESFDIINAAFEGVTDGEAIHRFDYFQSLVESCDEGINKYRSNVEKLIGKMIIHDNIHVKNMSSEVFKAFRKTLNNEDFVRDFLKDNFCSTEENDPELLYKKTTFLEALIADPYLQVSPILTSICLNPKENEESLYLSRAKLLRLLGDKFLPDPAKMLSLILKLILEGKALLEIEETSKYLANDTYVDLGTAPEVIEELTLAIKNLIPKIPSEKIYEWQEYTEELYKECVSKDKVGVYIVFMSGFIHHPRFQSDLYAEMHMKNICRNIDTANQDLLSKLVDCLESGAQPITKDSSPQAVTLH